MSESPLPPRIAVIWSPEARGDLRAIDRQTADVKKLKHSSFWVSLAMWRLPIVF